MGITIEIMICQGIEGKHDLLIKQRWQADNDGRAIAMRKRQREYAGENRGAKSQVCRFGDEKRGDIGLKTGVKIYKN